jgi:hypothetical protein
MYHGHMIFQPAARYPADPRAVFILALSAFGGVSALAIKAAPETLEAVLPRWAVLVWGLLLVIGSVTTLLGMARQTLNGIITEQVGSVTVGATTVFYSAIALWVIGPNAVAGISPILGWGIACFWRWGQLQSLIRRSYREALATKTVAAVESARTLNED